MLNYIKGEITIVTASFIVIESGGLGYEVRVPNPFRFNVGSVITLYTRLIVREDDVSLVGFATSEERDFFLRLLSVKGIGPKSALAVLAGGNVQAIKDCIARGDSHALQAFPGIGPKAANQIVLDLAKNVDVKTLTLAEKESPAGAQVREALQAMGYRTPEIKRVMPLVEEKRDQPLDQLVRLALKELSQ